MTPGAGHVFVVRGDLTKIACDWKLIPARTRLECGRGGDHWLARRAVVLERPTET